MSKQIGGGKINPTPCNDAQRDKNFQLIADVLNPIIDGNNNPGTPGNLWPFVRFQLAEAFGATTAGLSIDAKVLDDTGMDTGEFIDIYDVEGRYGAAVAGDKGYGSIYGDTPVYEALVIGEGGGVAVDPDDVFNNINIIGGSYDPSDTGGFSGTLTIIADGTEQYRLIRGKTTTAVRSSDTTFLIDEVIPLSSGIDPVSGNPATTVRVANIFGNSWNNNEWVQAIYSENANASPDADWEAIRKANDGADGASGVFTVVLSTDLEAGSESELGGPITGTVRSIGQFGALTEVGQRGIYNPFPFALPSDGIYTCAKTWADPDDEEDDEYTIVGVDVINLLKSLSGFADNKVLTVDASSIVWDDPMLECATGTFVTEVSCNSETGELTVTTQEVTFVAGPCPE